MLSGSTGTDSLAPDYRNRSSSQDPPICLLSVTMHSIAHVTLRLVVQIDPHYHFFFLNQLMRSAGHGPSILSTESSATSLTGNEDTLLELKPVGCPVDPACVGQLGILA